MTTAVVVGSGPNGLAAAVRLAQAGVRVRVLEGADRAGGGTRTSELTLPGVLHDDCSAAHPSGVASPYLRGLGLERFGLRWRWPDVDLAHPLDGANAAVLRRDVAATAAALGADGPAWRSLFGPLARRYDDLAGEVMGPALHLPRHPVVLARFGIRALLPATLLARRWSRDPARALFMGSAAHVFGRLDTPLSSAAGLLLTANGHAYGWPVAEGGSARIADALIGLLGSLGGQVETGRTVRSLNEVADADLVLLDTAPDAALRIAGDRLPPRVRRGLRRFSYGPAAFKVDFAVHGDVPWSNPDCRRAGTVHVGGTAEEIVAAEGAAARGVMPGRPFVLVCQQYLADPSRSAGGVNPVWAYAHVPHGYAGDATESITAQIERFAPGFRDRVVGRHVRSPAELAAYNPNYVGGDISAGANSGRQLLLRPRATTRPYWLAPGVYLCSSATPPGGGVHGMCGVGAAEAALTDLEGLADPDLADRGR